MREPQPATGGTEPARGAIPAPAPSGRVADPVGETRWSRLLVQLNAVLWALLLPAGLLLVAFVAPVFPLAVVVGWPVAAVFGNLVGSLGLAHAHGRLGGSGVTVVAGALIQFLGIVGPGSYLLYVGFLVAYHQIADPAPAIAAASVVAGVLYLTGQLVTAVSLRTLSRRLAIWYGAAPALLLVYAALAVVATVSGYEPSVSVGVVVTVTAIGFFVAMSVIWFRLAVHLRRRAQALLAPMTDVPTPPPGSA